MIKTVSLETAKSLKEAGFPQETTLFYRVDEFGNVFERNANEDPLKIQKVLGTNIYYAKPTTDELLEELPDQLEIKKAMRGWGVGYHIVERRDNAPFQYHDSLPEALASIYLFLKKENLLGKIHD